MRRHAIVELLLRGRHDKCAVGLQEGAIWAVVCGASPKTLRLLLDAGASPSSKCHIQGATALHWALAQLAEAHACPDYYRDKGDAEAVVRLLIARGADLGVGTIQTLQLPGRPHSAHEIGREDSPPAPIGATPRETAIAVSRNAAARDAVLAVYDDAVAQRVA